MNKDRFLKIGQLFISKGETIAIAESVTGGMLQNTFASMENAEKFFQGGLTAYNLGQKARHLQIEPIHAVDCNCVSEKTAIEMATNVCMMFQSTWGIAITGYATPVPESANALFAYYAIVKNGKLKKAAKLSLQQTTPEKVKQHYIDAIMNALLTMIK